MRTVAGGSDVQGGKQPREEEEKGEEAEGGMMKFRGVKERVTATQTLHAAL